MQTLTLLRRQVRDAHALLDRTVEALDSAALEWGPPGTANPIGATLAHVAVAEDVIVHAVLRGMAPLHATAWDGRTGLSEPMPMPGPEWSGYAAWTRRVRVDADSLRAYARAVFAATETYLDSIQPDALDRELDLSAMGRGVETVGWAIGRLVAGHCDNITGEIACLKGLQGLGGYGA